MFTNGLFETPFRWIGKTVLGFNYEFDVSGYGSGDNTYAYITLFVNIILALTVTILWSLLQRKKEEYNKFFYWFLVVLRFFIIAAMLLYGFVKVFQIQFQPPSFVKLLQPMGEYSPMGLAWTYMGYSKGFGMFAGLMEIIGGVLLVWKRTATLGAFIVIGVMTQVAMMNLMFDIPVKLFSIHLILMAGVIFMTDIKRFTSVFIKNNSTESYNFYHPITSKSYHKVIRNIKIVVLPIVLIAGCLLSYLGQLNISDQNHRPALYGIWEAKSFVRNNDTVPPLVTDSHRWRYLLIERKGNAIVKTMTDNLVRHTFITDTIENKISIYSQYGIKDSLNFKYSLENSKYLKLFGILENDSLVITLTKKDVNKFPLKSRGFRWINERPYNK
ncbi:DoxX family protein [uncultured Winogradskyella sp.]|uniref:DoxX family protein n=1 Tax=uncultured Winogradskyella sp. TaxID=395353 RepID=UPI0026188284|nr:DoxX family protein [uncultured Winogradskyella sp.]